MDPLEQIKDAFALEMYIRQKNLTEVKRLYPKLQNNFRFHKLFGGTPLQKAVEAENLETVKLLVEMGADIYETYTELLPHYKYSGQKDMMSRFFLRINGESMNALNQQGNSPLTQAVQRNCSPAIRYLLEKNADLTLKGPNGITPLCAAITMKNMEVIELLHPRVGFQEYMNSILFAIDTKSDWLIVEKLFASRYLFHFYCSSTSGEEALCKSVIHSALKMYGFRMVNYLIQSGFFLQLFSKAIASHYLETVGLLISSHPNIVSGQYDKNKTTQKWLDCFVDTVSKGTYPIDPFLLISANNFVFLRDCLMDPNSGVVKSKYLNEICSSTGDSLISLAVERNDLKTVKFLVESGGNVCKVDQNGRTPLQKAVIGNNLEIAKYLLQNEAALTANTALIAAIQDRNLPMVNLLIQYIDDFNFEDKTGEPLLNVALQSLDIDIVKVLLDKKVDISYCGSKEQTPLELSVELKFNAATKLLISSGADPNSFLENENATLLHKYLDIYDFVMIQFLIENGADVNQLDKDLQCPLVKITEMKHAKLLCLILRKGANPFCEHFEGTSLLSIAVTEQYFPVVKYLIENGAYVKGAKEALQNLAKQSHDFAIYLKKHVDFSNDFEGEVGHEAA